MHASIIDMTLRLPSMRCCSMSSAPTSCPGPTTLGLPWLPVRSGRARAGDRHPVVRAARGLGRHHPAGRQLVSGPYRATAGRPRDRRAWPGRRQHDSAVHRHDLRQRFAPLECWRCSDRSVGPSVGRLAGDGDIGWAGGCDRRGVLQPLRERLAPFGRCRLACVRADAELGSPRAA